MSNDNYNYMKKNLDEFNFTNKQKAIMARVLKSAYEFYSKNENKVKLTNDEEAIKFMVPVINKYFNELINNTDFLSKNEPNYNQLYKNSSLLFGWLFLKVLNATPEKTTITLSEAIEVLSNKNKDEIRISSILNEDGTFNTQYSMGYTIEKVVYDANGKIVEKTIGDKHNPLPKVAKELWKNGYDYEFVNAMRKECKFNSSNLIFGSVIDYQSLKTLEELDELIKNENELDEEENLEN